MEIIPQLSGSELVRISMMLQEANALASHIGKKIIFTREDFLNSERDDFDSIPSKIFIRLYNKENKTTTLWELEKFENQLVQMRELYQGELDSSIIKTSDIFNHPDDKWNKDLGLYTPAKIRTRDNAENSLDNSDFSIMERLPSLPSTLPESLVSVLTSSTEELHTPIKLKSQFLTQDDQTSTNNIVTKRFDNFEGTTLTSHLSSENVAPSVLPMLSDCFDSIRSVPELCSERIDRLLIDLKNNRTITSLEKFLKHSEYLIICAEDFIKSITTKSYSLCIPLAESDDVRYAAFNMSTSYEMVVTYGTDCCHIVLANPQCDPVEKELFDVGINVKQILFSTQPASRVNIKKAFSKITDQLGSIVNQITQALLSQLVHSQANSRRGSRVSKLANEHKSLDIHLQAHQFFSHQGKLTSYICGGVLKYVSKVSLQTVSKIRSCYQHAQETFQNISDDSLLTKEVLAGISKVLLSVLKFISAASQVAETLDGHTKDIESLFKDLWSKLVWVLNTFICIENCVVRLVDNVKESLEKHGELEKIVSQTNVIAFHAMSATSSLDELKQQGYYLLPENLILEPLSKDVIRSAKNLNNIAKRSSGISTSSLSTTQGSV